MLGDYLAIVNRELDIAAFVAAVEAWGPALEALGWRTVCSAPTGQVLSRGPRPPPVQPITRDQGLLIGQTFPRAPGVERVLMGFDEAAFERQCRRLTSDYWGAYVALRWPTETRRLAVFRDPGGALESFVWQAAGVTVITSSARLAVPPALKPTLGLNWDRIAGLLDDPARIAHASALEGVRALWPGEIWVEGPAAGAIQVWTPGPLTRPGGRSDVELQAELVRRVDQVVGACVTCAGRSLVEVSGGLDSSIVASSAAQVPGANVGAWLNYRASNARSDERGYARAVARSAGFELTEAIRPVAPFSMAAWGALFGGLRPPLNGLETQRDTDLAERCAALACDQVVTGQGGDVVFFQDPTARVVADMIVARAKGRDVLRAARDVGRWTRQSAWSVLRQAVAAGRADGDGPAYPRWAPITPGCLEAARSAQAHPWQRELQEVPPGKRLQIAGLVACQTFHGDSHTGRRASVLHPLLAQPVVELCLQIPTPQLTRGRRDRAFAREAFAERLPALITQRRAKGELASHYGQVVAASLGDLRPRLLDGELVRHGLLDRQALEAALTPEALILTGDAFSVATTALIEGWAADWVARV